MDEISKEHNASVATANGMLIVIRGQAFVSVDVVIYKPGIAKPVLALDGIQPQTITRFPIESLWTTINIKR